MFEDKKQIVKTMISRLHEGEDPEVIKKEYGDFLRRVDASIISKAEEELIREGMPREEVHKLCDVHLTVFDESLSGKSSLALAGHPIHILMEEHRVLLATVEELYMIAEELVDETDVGVLDEKISRMKHLVTHFKESTRHYHREENVLFPYLEKHGIKEPPAIMWMEHDKIRATEGHLFRLMELDTLTISDSIRDIQNIAIELNELLSSHFYKENNILFPTSLQVITDDEWGLIRSEFDEIGYCCFTPEVSEWNQHEPSQSLVEDTQSADIHFETGHMTKEELQAVLNSLPIDITFVDAKDQVKYFSDSKERIFVRSKAVIGRDVHLCHPQKSVHVVKQILDDFREGTRDKAEFWIDLGGRLIHIRYFAVRNNNGSYLGCLEASQDITEIKQIEGQKRLLDPVV
ncbi:MAG: Histidine kinase [Candidatus Thorarchaeota archaeon]|nr:MAG: Histidine kinase [Candidatus Thorarchaeota archaeon]